MCKETMQQTELLSNFLIVRILFQGAKKERDIDWERLPFGRWNWPPATLERKFAEATKRRLPASWSAAGHSRSLTAKLQKGITAAAKDLPSESDDEDEDEAGKENDESEDDDLAELEKDLPTFE